MRLQTLASTAVVVVLTLISLDVNAIPVDFTRKIQGDIFESGQKTGSYEYLFSYNTTPSNLKVTPDIIDPDYIVTYSPFPAYQDKYQLDLFLYLDANSSAPGNWSVQDASITSFIVANDFEFQFSNPDDELVIIAQAEIAGTLQNITMSFKSDDHNALSSISLDDILTGQSEGIFTPSNGFGLFPGGIAETTGFFYANVNSVGPMIVKVETPATWPLIAVGISGLYAFWRRRKFFPS